MEYSLADAAKLAGVNRSTLFRAIKSGRLSARRLDDRTFRVDASELARVFDLQQAVRNGTDAVQQGAQGTDVAATAATVAPNAALEQEVAVLKARLEGVEAQLAREREVSEDLQKRLDDAQEERRGLQRLIPPPQEPRPERRTASWWPWRR